MRLYIPEIGDSLVLESDWTFELYPENRNVALGFFFGHWLHYDSKLYPNSWNWVSKYDLLPIRNPDYHFSEPWPTRNYHSSFFNAGESHEDYQKRLDEFTSKNPEYVKWNSDNKLFMEEAKKYIKSSIPVTIPQGCKLVVDRIYIRKGSADFSSISFYVKDLGDVDYTGWTQSSLDRLNIRVAKKGVPTHRFWAKLADVNKIEILIKQQEL